ncbi:hypothetical protein [Streptomyces sp. NPDC002172]
MAEPNQHVETFGDVMPVQMRAHELATPGNGLILSMEVSELRIDRK